jgi:hypothetical protein
MVLPRIQKGFFMKQLLALVTSLVFAACSVEFNDDVYVPLCWREGACVQYLNLMPETETLLAQLDPQVDAADLTPWTREIEGVDGVFDFIGTARMASDDKVRGLQFMKDHEALVLDLFAAVDAELRAVLPQVLGRNSPAQLATIRVVVAPFLQATNASVGTSNDGDIVLVFAPDRLAFNVAGRQQSREWVRSVVAHELTHASHFAMVPYSTTYRRQSPMYRSLWVEGLALHGSVLASSSSRTLADIIGADSANVCQRIRDTLVEDYRTDIESTDAHDIWWADRGRDPREYGIITPGYCVAFLVMGSLIEQHGFETLLTWSPDEAYPRLLQALSTTL